MTVSAPARLVAMAAALGLGAALGACSSGDSGGGGDAIAITATAAACEVAQTQLAAGRHTFVVDNKGSEITEVYVYGPGDKVISEKEHIGPGTQAKFSATLAAGQYEIACKPGETGNGIRTTITVT